MKFRIKNGIKIKADVLLTLYVVSQINLKETEEGDGSLEFTTENHFSISQNLFHSDKFPYYQNLILIFKLAIIQSSEVSKVY